MQLSNIKQTTWIFLFCFDFGFLYFSWKIDSSLIPTCFPSLFSSQLFPPLSTDPFPFKKEQFSKRWQSSRTKKDTIIQGESPPNKTWESNAVGENVPRADKRVEDSPTPIVRNSTKTETNNHSKYAEDLLQTHAGSGLTVSVSVITYEPYLIDSVGNVLLVSSIPSNSYSFSSASSVGFPNLWGEGCSGYRQFKLSVFVLSGCGSLCLLPSADGESFSDDDWTRLQSMSIAEYL